MQLVSSYKRNGNLAGIMYEKKIRPRSDLIWNPRDYIAGS